MSAGRDDRGGGRSRVTDRRTPAIFMRGGTSNAVIFHAHDLPPAGPQRDALFCRVMGSPDPYGRQLDGLGGGISSLSKVMVLAPPSRPDVDFDYTFGQVEIAVGRVDYAANCGNMTSAMGPFAVNEGLFKCQDGDVLLRLFNTNTRQVVHAAFEVAGGFAVEMGDLEIPGVAGTGSPIRLDFMARDDGAGPASPLMSQALTDVIQDPVCGAVTVSIVDASNVVAFARASDLGLQATESIETIEGNPRLMATLERLRRQAAVLAGMASTPEAAAEASPKIALIGPPADFTALDNRQYSAVDVDVSARVLSMGNVHRAIPLTAAMCTAAAAGIVGTSVHQATSARSRAGADALRIGTLSGVVKAAADVQGSGVHWTVPRTSTFRTARRLMSGWVHG